MNCFRMGCIRFGYSYILILPPGFDPGHKRQHCLPDWRRNINHLSGSRYNFQMPSSYAHAPPCSRIDIGKFGENQGKRDCLHCAYQPASREILPIAARLAGNMKTSEPIMLPAIISVAVVRPILRFSATCGAASATSGMSSRV